MPVHPKARRIVPTTNVSQVVIRLTILLIFKFPSHSLLLTATIIMSSNQRLPTFNFAQSSIPLVFSVSKFFFSSYFPWPKFFCPQKTTCKVPNVPNILIPLVTNPNVPNPLILLAAYPNVPNPLIPAVTNHNVPNPNTPFPSHCSVAGVIYGVGRSIWVSVICILSLFIFKFVVFL